MMLAITTAAMEKSSLKLYQHSNLLPFCTSVGVLRCSGPIALNSGFLLTNIQFPEQLTVEPEIKVMKKRYW